MIVQCMMIVLVLIEQQQKSHSTARYKKKAFERKDIGINENCILTQKTTLL